MTKDNFIDFIINGPNSKRTEKIAIIINIIISSAIGFLFGLYY